MISTIHRDYCVPVDKKEAALRKYDQLRERGYPIMIAAARCGFNANTVRRWDIARTKKK